MAKLFQTEWNGKNNFAKNCWNIENTENSIKQIVAVIDS